MADSWIYPRLLIVSVCFVLLKGQSNQCDNPSPLSPMCHSMPYNSTSFPNSVYNMIDSATAEMEIQQFQPLVNMGCSDVIREFLCSVYFPDCVSGSGDVPPCREVCVAARQGCEGQMNNFGFSWPSHLNCENFPSRGAKVCTYFESKMNIESITGSAATTTSIPGKTAATTFIKGTAATTTSIKETATTTYIEGTVAAATTTIAGLVTTMISIQGKTAATTISIPGKSAATTTAIKGTPAPTTLANTLATTTRSLTAENTTTTTLNQCSEYSRLAPMCDGMPYNRSSFPNSILGLQNGEEAELAMQQYFPLIKIQCSDVIKEFICSVYFPECDIEYGDIPPCRETCQYARAGCGNLMMRFGFEWPPSLKCANFPSRDTKRCAYYESKMISTSSTPATTSLKTTTTSIPKTAQQTTTWFPKTAKVTTSTTPASTTLAKIHATTTKSLTTENTTMTPTSIMNKCSEYSRLAPMCDGMPYNRSSFPNSILGLQNGEEAGMEIHQYFPLIKIQCSDVIKEFLCSAYFPECDIHYGDIPPCRETCQYAQAGCGNILVKFGFKWPQSLNCERFPSRDSKRCAYYESKMLSTTTTTTTTTTTPTIRLPAICKTNPDDVALPNTLGHWSLKEAVKNFETFHSMLSSSCSSELSQYLCHVHFPQSAKSVKPCWEFCLRVRTQCLFQLPVPWPKSFRCETFPAQVTSQCWDKQSPSPMLNIIQGAFRLLTSLLQFAASS